MTQATLNQQMSSATAHALRSLAEANSMPVEKLALLVEMDQQLQHYLARLVAVLMVEAHEKNGSVAELASAVRA